MVFDDGPSEKNLTESIELISDTSHHRRTAQAIMMGVSLLAGLSQAQAASNNVVYQNVSSNPPNNESYATTIGYSAGSNADLVGNIGNIAVGATSGLYVSGTDNTMAGGESQLTTTTYGSYTSNFGTEYEETNEGTPTSSGSYNTGVGYGEDQFNHGSYLAGIGDGAMVFVTGTGNVGVGYLAGTVTSGNNNIGLGPSAEGGYNYPYPSDPPDVIGNNNIGVGYDALGLANGSNNLGLGYYAGTIITGSNNLGAGYYALYNVTGSDDVGIGSSASYRVSGSNDVGIGPYALERVTGSDNTIFGRTAGLSVTGSFNTALGVSGASKVSGMENTALGVSSADSVTGSWNTAFGSRSGDVLRGADNTDFGQISGVSVSGSSNTAFGLNVGISVTGSNNLAFGASAGNAVSGSNNIAVGIGAVNASAANQTIVFGMGAQAGANNAIAIGTSASATGLNAIAIGSGATNAIANTVEFGVSGTPLSLTNIAAGVAPTDGVDMAQLNMLNNLNTANELTVSAIQSSAGVISGINTTNVANTILLGDMIPTASTVVATGDSYVTSLPIASFILSAGNGNIGIGATAGVQVSGSQNLALGLSTGGSVAGGLNVAAGAQSGDFATGATNTMIGVSAGVGTVGSGNTGFATVTSDSITGQLNTSLGVSSSLAVTGNDNSAIGYAAAQSVIGNANIAAGDSSGYGIIGNRNIAIGLGAENIGSSQTVLLPSALEATATPADVITESTTPTVIYGPVDGSDNIGLGTSAGLGVEGVYSSSVALGLSAQAPLDSGVALGTSAVAVGANAVALGENTQAVGNNSIALGPGSVVTQANVLSIGTVNAERRIENVAPGIAPTDGVNFNQIDEMNQSVDNSINSMQTVADSGVALAMAQSGALGELHPNADKRTVIGFGTGYYEGDESTGVAVSTLSESGRDVYSVAASIVPGTIDVGAQASIRKRIGRLEHHGLPQSSPSNPAFWQLYDFRNIFEIIRGQKYQLVSNNVRYRMTVLNDGHGAYMAEVEMLAKDGAGGIWTNLETPAVLATAADALHYAAQRIQQSVAI